MIESWSRCIASLILFIFICLFFGGGDRMGWCLNGSGTNDVVSVWKKRNSHIIKMPRDLLINCNFC